MAATGGRDYEHAEIRFDPAGGVVLMTGSMDHGQGHATTFAQILSFSGASNGLVQMITGQGLSTAMIVAADGLAQSAMAVRVKVAEARPKPAIPMYRSTRRCRARGSSVRSRLPARARR